MTELKDPYDNILEMVKCSMKECKKEMDEYAKIRENGYNKFAILFQKYSKNLITEDKFQKENTKIMNEINKKKEAIDYIKCRIDNCNNYIRNNLIYTVNRQLKFTKDKKTKIILNNYLKLFQEKEINPKDVKKFYMETKNIIK
jgi:hypothetical protein